MSARTVANLQQSKTFLSAEFLEPIARAHTCLCLSLCLVLPPVLCGHRIESEMAACPVQSICSGTWALSDVTRSIPVRAHYPGTLPLRHALPHSNFPVFTNSWQTSYKKKERERDKRRLANAILKQRSGLEGKKKVWIGATEGGHYYMWRP